MTSYGQRVFFIICNYNGERNGALSRSLDRLSEAKTPDTVVSVFDNGSTDGSVEVLLRHFGRGSDTSGHSSGVGNTIDSLFLSGGNNGKSRAMNALAENARIAHGMEAMDVVVSMDSDIAIMNSDFIRDIGKMFRAEPRLGFMGFEYYEDEGLTKVSPYNRLERGVNISDGTISAFGREYREMCDFAGRLAGGLLAMRAGMFMAVGGYPTKTPLGRDLPVYGGDDCLIEHALWRRYGGKCLFLFDDRPQIFHPKETDAGYQAWKDKSLADLGRVLNFESADRSEDRVEFQKVGYFEQKKDR